MINCSVWGKKTQPFAIHLWFDTSTEGETSTDKDSSKLSGNKSSFFCTANTVQQYKGVSNE